MRSKILSAQILCLAGAVVCITAALRLSPDPSHISPQRGNLKKIAVPAALSFGHREFAWLLWGLGGLSAAVNAWDASTNPNTPPEQTIRTGEKLREFAQNLPEFAREQLGMREIFIFPASYFAFSTNEIELALEIAQQGIEDPRIKPDLTLTAAYLIHLFKNDPQAAADAYQKLLEVFPQSTWLNKTISKLREGKDPFLEDPANMKNNCKRLLTLFPLSKSKLIERGICPADKLNKSGEL
ncbi:MAG: hypothetical protein FJY29_03840 [Betaproteobacteria bacterium]|nr:hypothetical protein [Betaproteobacteria bacterium]